MRLASILIAMVALLLPAAAAPIPRFDDPKALLEAVYAGFTAMEDWDNYDPDAHFDETEAFSTRLTELHRMADDIVDPTGEYMGALDFSPFIYGQDSGGLTYAIGTPKRKGGRASAQVEILLEGKLLHTIGFELVDEGGDIGWRVDDIIMPDYDTNTSWRLSEYFADPLDAD
jgi:hypothetical protein